MPANTINTRKDTFSKLLGKTELSQTQKNALIEQLFPADGKNGPLADVLEDRKPYFFTIPEGANAQKKAIYRELQKSFLDAIKRSYNADGTLNEPALEDNLKAWRSSHFNHYDAIITENQAKQNEKKGLLHQINDSAVKDKNVLLAKLDIKSMGLRYNNQLRKNGAYLDTPIIVSPREPEQNAHIERLAGRLKQNQDVDTLMVPVHIRDDHWVLVVRKKDSIEFFDSQGDLDPKSSKAIKDKLAAEFPGQKVIHNADQKLQQDKWSCGYHMMKKALQEGGIDCPLTQAGNDDPAAMKNAVIDMLKAPIPGLRAGINATVPFGPPAQDFRDLLNNEAFKGKKIARETDENNNEYSRVQINNKKSANDLQVYSNKISCMQPSDKSLKEMAKLLAAGKDPNILIKGDPDKVAKLAAELKKLGKVPYVLGPDGKPMKYDDRVAEQQKQHTGNKPEPQQESAAKKQPAKEQEPQQENTAEKQEQQEPQEKKDPKQDNRTTGSDSNQASDTTETSEAEKTSTPAPAKTAAKTAEAAQEKQTAAPQPEAAGQAAPVDAAPETPMPPAAGNSPTPNAQAAMMQEPNIPSPPKPKPPLNDQKFLDQLQQWEQKTPTPASTPTPTPQNNQW